LPVSGRGIAGWPDVQSALFMRKALGRMYRKLARRITRAGVLPDHDVFHALHRFIVSAFTPSRIVIGDQTVYLDPVDSLGLARSGGYEQLTLELMRRLVKPGDTAVDIGANIGYFTLFLSRATGRGGKVYAFEPSPQNFSLLRKNLRINAHAHAVAEEKAVADRAGQIDLYLSWRSNGQHTLFGDRKRRRSVPVGMVSLDGYFPPNTPVDFIKMDIEGAEVHALKGMQRVLSDNPRLRMIVEFNPGALVLAGTDPAEFPDRLQSAGFVLFDVNNRKGTIERTTAVELLQRYTPASGRYTNLLCVRDPSLVDADLSASVDAVAALRSA